MNTELIEYTTAEHMANVFAVESSRIREAVETLADASQHLRETFRDSYRFTVNAACGVNCRNMTADEIAEELKLAAWSAIIAKLNVRRLMSSKRVKELDDALAGEGEAMPDITPEAIQQVVAGYVASANEFLEEAVAEEYDYWRPDKQHAPYKRNSDWKLNRKIIRPHVIRYVCYRTAYYLCTHDAASHVTALDNIFHMLDGKGPVKEYKGALVSAIESSEDGTGETAYFKFKCCKNGNLHLEFKRDDLLTLFNRIAGKARLGHVGAA